MDMKQAYSTKKSTAEVIADLKEQLNNFEVKVLIFFASIVFDQELLNKEIKNAFPESTIFGCSTAGEIVDGKFLKNSVVAMAFSKESIEDIKVEIVENVKDVSGVKLAFDNFKKYFNESMNTLDFNKYVGIILIDGLSSVEEKIMDKIGDMTNINFIGGSAGDDMKFEKTYVYADGKVYSNAAVLAVLKPTRGFEIIKTQSFRSIDKKLVATKVNEEERIVYEFNNKPATLAYAEELGVSVEEVPNKFFGNPVGLVAGDDLYVRSPQQVVEGTAIKFFCNLLQDMEVELLENTDIIGDTQRAIAQKEETGDIKGMLFFSCILRRLELESRGKANGYEKLGKGIPTIGFSTYGEQYIGHMNHTATILAFK